MSLFKYLILGLIVFSLGGCYPDSSISPVESDSVYTNYNPIANFSDYKYYSLTDSVLRFDNNGEYYGGIGQYDDLILDRVEQNLDARGFVKIVEGDIIEANVNVVVSDLTALTITSYWNYIPYWYYAGYWGDLPNNSSYAYYPGAVPTSVSLALYSNIVVDMIEASKPVIIENDTLDVYWRAIATGIYDIKMDARMTRNIDQMFFQSPYLKPQTK